MPRANIRSDQVRRFNGVTDAPEAFSIRVNSPTQLTVGPGSLGMAGPVTFVGTTVANNPVITSANTSLVEVGAQLFSASSSIPVGARVIAVTPNVSVTMSVPALSAATSLITTDTRRWSFAGGTLELGKSRYVAKRIGPASGSPTATCTDTSGLEVGQKIYASAFAADTTVVSFVTNTSVTLSANANSNSAAVAMFTSGTTQLADGSWYIGIDPNTWTRSTGVLGPICAKLHAFKWRIHTGMVWLARVTRTAGVVQVVETYTPQWPTSGLTRFKGKLMATDGTNGAPVRIGIMGTSLSNFPALTTRLNLDSVPTSTTSDWLSLLFADDITGTTAAQTSASFRIPYRTVVSSRFTIDNVSMSSNNVHYHACWLADGVQGFSASGTPGTAWSIRPGSMEKAAVANWRSVRRSPFISNPYDLVIVDTTPNGGTHKMAHADNIVRKLRKVGTEVVLIRALQTDTTCVADLLTFTIPELVRIAQERGCDICDWASFHWEAVEQFVNPAEAFDGGTATPAYGANQVFQDKIHPAQNRNGNGLSAEALRSLINDLPQAPSAGDSTMTDRVVVPEVTLPTASQSLFPTHYEFSAFPASSAGSLSYSAGGAGIYGGTIVGSSKMPENVHGGKTAGSVLAASAPVTSMNDGTAILRYAHPFAIGADILVDYTGSAYGFNITDGASTIVPVAVTTGLGSAKGFLAEGPQATTVTNWRPAQSAAQLGGPWANTVLTLTYVSGTPLIRGVLWHLPGEIVDVPATEFRYVGTWSQGQAGPEGIQSVCATTSTASDLAEVTVDGRMAFLCIEQGATSGPVNVWLNGEQIYSGLATTTAGTQLGYLRIQPVLGGISAAAAAALPELGTSIPMQIRIQNVNASPLKIVGVHVVK